MKKITLLLSAVLFAAMSFAAALGEGYAKVTDITTLVAGDKVVLYCDDADLGVTGWNGNKDATVAATGWVEYVVETADGGVYLKDGEQYITGAESANQFKYGEKAVCGVTATGALACGSKWLCQNNNNGTLYYRMYKTTTVEKYPDSYKVFYVYEVTGEGGSTTPDQPTEPETPVEPEEPETPAEPETPGASQIEIPAEAAAWNIPAEAIDVLQARAICAAMNSGDKSGTKYYVMGYVKDYYKSYENFESSISGYGNASFYIENVKGANSDEVFLAYQVCSLNGEKMTDPSTVAIGDFVVIYGELTNYNGTYETVGKGAAYIWNSTNAVLNGGETPDTPVEPEEPETPAEVVTIADGLALAENATCVLNPFTVVYVANQYVYIEDESAYALLFKYDSGLKAGDKVTGMEVSKSTYNDIPQFKPVSMEGITIEAGEAPALDEITSAPTVADNHIVKLLNVTLPGAIVANATVVATCSDNTTINIYSKSDFAIEEGKAYNIIGGVTQYKGNIQIQAYEVEEYKAETTGVEDITVNEKVAKVIKNGQIYIIKGGKTYNALGAEVK